jgi:NAD(P)-dependent dehydrogenase (short-subunit alcohol dehydrogenase family)
LIGRTASILRETANLVPDKLKIEIYATSVKDKVKMKEAAERVGAWDILVLGAANIIPLSWVADVDLGEWLKQYEASVKSIVVVTQAFMPRAKNGASIYGITSSALVMPPALLPGYSAYSGAKMAQVKVLEFLANEMRESNVVSVHPGIVDTKMMRSGGGSPEHLPMDKGE